MDIAGAHPEWFGGFYALSFLVSYLVAAWVGYRRGWPPAAWLLVLAAAGIGGVLGARLLPLGLDGLRALLDTGTMPETPTRRIPGAVAGALGLAVAARWALGIRRSVLDPLAYSGLAALAVVRVGCFVAGCCFGTPTDAPWGVTYASGSFVHGFHLAHGIVETGALTPHPVHPIPLYDIAFALIGLSLLPRLSRILKAPGSLCWATVGIYAAYRFAQDFVRANETTGTLGLTSVQVVCAIAAVLALAWVLLRERGQVHETPEVEEPGVARLGALFAGLVLVRAALDGWWTPAEEAVLFVRLLPAGAALAVVAWRRGAAPQVRWAATVAAAGLPIVLGFQLTPADSSRDRFSFLAVDAHAAQGRYEDGDICSSSLHEYRSGGIGVAHVTVDSDRSFSREVGVRVYGGTQQTAYDVRQFDEEGNPYEAPAEGLAAAIVVPYVQIEGKHLGGHFGAQIGQVPLGADDEDNLPVFPSFGARMGPRSFHVQFGMLDGPHFGAPAAGAHLGFGTGTLTRRGQEVRAQIGVSGTGPYVSGMIPVGNLTLEPMLALGEKQTRYFNSAPFESDFQIYQASLRARYQFGGPPEPIARVPVAPTAPPDTTTR